MKCYILLAVTFTVAQAVTRTLTNTPVSSIRNYNPGTYQGRPSLGLGISGRRDFQETLHQETGNFYGGQREGRFLTRDSGDNYRGIQYSTRPNRDYTSGTFQRGDGFQQQGIRRYQDGGDGFRYSGRNPQVSFTAPLANTRSFNPRYDTFDNRQNEYRYY